MNSRSDQAQIPSTGLRITYIKEGAGEIRICVMILLEFSSCNN